MTPSSPHVDAICAADGVLAYVIRSEDDLDRTSFLTSDDAVLQVGFVVHEAGSAIRRHFHLPIERHIVGTPEVLVVRSGRCEMDVYDEDQNLAGTRQLGTGDIMVMLRGGHGFRMLEDTVLLEVKQGPYFGLEEKKYF